MAMGKTSTLTGRNLVSEPCGGGGVETGSGTDQEEDSALTKVPAHRAGSTPGQQPPKLRFLPPENPLLCGQQRTSLFCATDSTGLPTISTDRGSDKRVTGHYG